MSAEATEQEILSPPHSHHDGLDQGLIKPNHFRAPFTPPATVRPSPRSNPALSAYNSPSQYPPIPPQGFRTTPSNFSRQLHYHTPPSDLEPGIMTRSGKTLGSPMGSIHRHERRPQTPKPRKNRSKPGKKPLPALQQPLSVLTRDYKIPVRDMGVWVNRSVQDRMKEVASKKGHVSRPMNSFMLYRSAYAERVKQFCKENNHQVVSQVTGQSWPLEPPEVRKTYEQYAVQERDNHAAAHPGYKFAPNKAGKKRNRDEDDSETDGDWEGSRSTKHSRNGRRDDTRSMSSTPFEADHASRHQYVPLYAPPHHPHPSSYQANNPYGPPPFAFGPDGMAGGHYQPQAIPYGQNIDDVRFSRTQDGYDLHGQPPQLIGMPDSVGHDLLGGLGDASLGPPIESLIDPQLNQLDPNYSYEQYGAMPGQSYQVTHDHVFDSYEPLGEVYHGGEVSHPGMATLTDEWSYGGQAGVDFDNELRQWN